MQYHTLPDTDLKVSALCLGTGSFGAGTEEADAFRLLDAFAEAGGSFLDTANVYGKWLPAKTSASELVIGRWMAARRARDRVVIGTKGGHPDLADWRSRLAPSCIVEDLDESLRSLGTDCIDLYYLHRDDESAAIEPLLACLEAQVAAGKIRGYGCSNWSTSRMREARAIAAANGWAGFVANQPLWNLAVPNPAALGLPGMRAMDADMYAWHRESRMAAVPYSAQAAGLFTKMSRPDFDAPVYDGIRANYLNPQTLARAERVRHLVAETSLDGTQLALLYLLKQPFVTVPVVGCKNVDHLHSSLAALSHPDLDLGELAGSWKGGF